MTRVRRPVVSVIAGLVLLLVLAVPVSAQVNRAESLDDYLSERLSSADLDQMQREVFSRVVEMRAVTELQVVASLGGMAGGLESGLDPGILTTRLPLGMDFTFLYASEGKNGGSKWGVSNFTTSYDLVNRRNLVGSWSSGAGQASGWAWVGRRFFLEGSGSRTASFSVQGYYAAFLQALGECSNAIMELRLRLYDASTAQWVGEGTIAFNVEIDNSLTHVDDYSRSGIITATVHGGHEYVVLLQFEGVSTSVAGFLAEVESGRPSWSMYSDWDSITISY